MTSYEAPKEPLPAVAKETKVDSPPDPGWEIPEEGTSRKTKFRFGGAATGWAIADRLDRVLPPHRRYLGRSRRTFLIVIIVIFIALLALVIGLAVGLSKKSASQSLPLPNGAETYTGDLTFYDPALGACGIDSGPNEAVVAVSHYTFDAVQKGSNPNNNPLCGKKIRAQRVNEEGKTVSIDVTVVDRCTGCKPTDLDVSPAMFKKMAHPDLGRVKTTWAWL
ncbi:RlpA-like double-psi beta-barrel-protein domain-containing protein-containing protein [Dendryphion nanum]|uniref:RlpA-like double-psi beta-barrel-protein domain-containing protein-containing protein n=1 Tax=Dendryphion nanum TaxID=256645 RepID=A0A9P9II37_9PLEO|nr:RlpA-like double-psi beta-barrel-protein domain-containing protein-containing protein [Dendryphion nanum]